MPLVGSALDNSLSFMSPNYTNSNAPYDMPSIKAVQAKSGHYLETSIQQCLFHWLWTVPSVSLGGAYQDYETVIAEK